MCLEIWVMSERMNGVNAAGGETTVPVTTINSWTPELHAAEVVSLSSGQFDLIFHPLQPMGTY